MKDQRVLRFPAEGLLLHCAPAWHTPWWLSATICWPTSDRPHEVNDRSHEVTDWPHQACVGAFDLSNGSLVPSRLLHWMKWVCSLVARPPPWPSFSQSWERGGWWTRTRVWSPHMPDLHRIQVVTVSKWWTIPKLNRKELEMQITYIITF